MRGEEEPSNGGFFADAIAKLPQRDLTQVGVRVGDEPVPGRVADDRFLRLDDVYAAVEFAPWHP